MRLAIGLLAAVLVLDGSAKGADEPPPFVRDGVLDLEAAVKHFEDLYRSTSSVAEVELTVTRPRRTRTMRMKSWTRGTEKALIIIQAPAREKGTASAQHGLSRRPPNA